MGYVSNKEESCPFCGSKEMSWIDHEEGCYLRMMEEEENDVSEMTYSAIEFRDAWNKRVKKKNVKKIVGMSCNTCGETEEVYLNIGINEDELSVSLGSDGKFYTMDGERNKVKLSKKQIKNAIFGMGDCCGECNDESEISIQFEDGCILCDDEAWEYYISELVD